MSFFSEFIFHIHKFYLDTFKDAMVTLRLRPIVPAVYNSDRCNEQPIPRADLTIDSNNQNDPSLLLTTNMNSTKNTNVEADVDLQNDSESTTIDSSEVNNPNILVVSVQNTDVVGADDEVHNDLDSTWFDLFEWRGGGHIDRLNNFEVLITNAISDIKVNKFK